MKVVSISPDKIKVVENNQIKEIEVVGEGKDILNYYLKHNPINDN